MRHACAGLVTTAALALAAAAGAAEAPGSSDLELVTGARTALGDIGAFQRLNDEIVRRCHEPVTGAYADWREEFRADLERARAVEQTLRRRLPADPPPPAADERLKAFVEVDGQALYSRCLRWSTLLIQRESPLRADVAARFALLRNHEARLREILADDAKWQEWRTAGALP